MIFRTNDPSQYDRVDGIVIDERAPQAPIISAGTGVALLIGQFSRGPEEVTDATNSYQDIFGSDNSSGNIALRNKMFSQLKIRRVVSSSAVKASFTTGQLTFTAKYKGSYGNSITVQIATGTSGKTYTIVDGENREVFSNITLLGNTEVEAEALFRSSEIVDVALSARPTGEPSNNIATALTGGVDGVVNDVDYNDAIDATAGEGIANIIFLDRYSSSVRAKLKTYVIANPDRIAIVSGDIDDTVSEAITNVGTLREAQGRLIYAYNAVKTYIGGVLTDTNPASWYASILSRSPAHRDPADVENAPIMAGAVGVRSDLSRAEFIQLNDAGISAFELAQNIGVKPKSPVNTELTNNTIVRRRMADFLTNSIGQFLVRVQNGVNSLQNRALVKGAILSWDEDLVALGILPSDAEVPNGSAVLVDTESLNTAKSLGEGRFLINYKRRIFSSMRFIVLRAEIGESVIVSETGE